MMRMTGSFINGLIDGALINYVHLWTLKFVDNAPYSFNWTNKVLFGMRHSYRSVIINTNGKSISVKLILKNMATAVSCISYASDVL